MTRVSLAWVGGALAASALAAAWVGFALGDADARHAAFMHYALPLACANLVALALAIVAFLRRRPASPNRAEAVLAGLVLLAVTLALVLASPSVMRVQTDESLIASTAFGIWTGAGPNVPIGFVRPDGVLDATVVMPDKRGIVVPLLIAILHFADGFRLEHGFWLNHAAAWAALCAVYATGRAWLAPPQALSAALFLCAFPVFAWAATSQTLEAVNLVALFGSAAAMTVAARRGDAGLACIVALAAPLVAQVRYESAIVAAIALPIAAWIVARAGSSRHAVLLLMVPWLFLPAAWQRARPFDYDLPGARATQAFGMDNLGQNLVHAFEFLSTPSWGNPSGMLVPLLAIVALLLGARRLKIQGSNAHLYVVPAAYGVAVAGITLLILCFAWGNVLRPETQRLALPALAAVSLAAASMPRALPKWHGVLGPLVLAVAGAAACWTLRALPTDASSSLLLGPAMTAAHAEAKIAFPGCRFLWVSPWAPFFVLHGESALTSAPLRLDWPATRARMEPHRLDAILALQVFDARTGAIVDNATLPPDFHPRPLLAGRLGDGAAYRVVQLAHRTQPSRAPASSRCRLGNPHDGSGSRVEPLNRLRTE